MICFHQIYHDSLNLIALHGMQKLGFENPDFFLFIFFKEKIVDKGKCMQKTGQIRDIEKGKSVRPFLCNYRKRYKRLQIKCFLDKG